MKTVNEVSRLSGVSIRTLRYYDSIGLLKPTSHTDSGYRLYDDEALEKLQQILLFRELQFPLREISRIMQSPNYDRKKALAQQIKLLTMKKEHLERLIASAKQIEKGGSSMKQPDFSAFDTRRMDEYATQAKKAWGQTAAYREYEQKSHDRDVPEEQKIGNQLMAHFAALGNLRGKPPESAEVQQWVSSLQSFISTHYYTCAKPILRGLGQMYASGGDFTANIDAAGGEGTAVFAAAAIEHYCRE